MANSLPPKPPLWHIRLATTLMAWAIAYGIVYTMLRLFGEQLEALPPALGALIFTGILVPIMGDLVMPFVGQLVSRRLNL